MIAREVIQGCINNQPADCKKLYEAYLPYLLAIVRRYGVSTNDEKDFIQEIFVEIFLNLKKYDDTLAQLSTWLRTVAVRKILNLKRKRMSFGFVDLDSVDVEHEITVQHNDYDASYIMDAIKKLPDGYREIFNLYEVDGFTHEEIGQLLSISTSSSRSQLFRAKQSLKAILQKHTNGIIL